MSIYGPWKVATITVTSDDDLSDEVDLGNNYEFAQLVLPALTSSTVYLKVCDVTGGTFVPLGNNQTTVASVGSYATTFRLGGYRFLKVATGTAQGADRSIKIRGYRM